MAKLGVTLKIGIGLHAGRVRVGNMGSSVMFDYTIVGDTVNLAERLEGLTRYYDLELLISESMKNSCGERFKCLEVDRIRVLGKKEPVTIFSVLPAEDSVRRKEEIETYNSGLALYRSGEFEEARKIFTRLSVEVPGMALYTIYRDRCTGFIENPPGLGWDKVFTHDRK